MQNQTHLNILLNMNSIENNLFLDISQKKYSNLQANLRVFSFKNFLYSSPKNALRDYLHIIWQSLLKNARATQDMEIMRLFRECEFRSADNEALWQSLCQSSKYTVKLGKRGKKLTRALHMAVFVGDIDSLQTLIKIGVGAGVDDINHMDESGYMPLHLAAIKNEIECVRILISIGASVDCLSAAGETPLYFAAESGFEDCVRLLITANCCVNMGNAVDKSPLVAAAHARHPGCAGCVKQLISAGSSVPAQYIKKTTTLLEKILWNARTHMQVKYDCICALIDSGLDIDARPNDSNYSTSLEYAIESLYEIRKTRPGHDDTHWCFKIP